MSQVPGVDSLVGIALVTASLLVVTVLSGCSSIGGPTASSAGGTPQIVSITTFATNDAVTGHTVFAISLRAARQYRASDISTMPKRRRPEPKENFSPALRKRLTRSPYVNLRFMRSLICWHI